MDKNTYPGLLVPEIQELTLKYKEKAEATKELNEVKEMERNYLFIGELYDIFFDEESSENESSSELVNSINNIFRKYKVKARFNVYENINRYDEVFYEFGFTYYEDDFYSDSLIKELILFLLSREELPLQGNDRLDIKITRNITISSINEFARNNSSKIRVISNEYSDVIEVVSIC